jgi:hypothetical protein
LTPGLRRMSCSELSVCLSTCSGQMSTCTRRASESVHQIRCLLPSCNMECVSTS